MGGKCVNYLHGGVYPVLVGRGWGTKGEEQFLCFRTIDHLLSMRLDGSEQGMIVKENSLKLDA